MKRYHINPKTGNANLCGAKLRCRFQEEGAPPVEHYATKEEAQAAYELSQGGGAVGAPQRRETKIVSEEQNSADLPSTMREWQERAAELTSFFLDETGHYVEPAMVDLELENFIDDLPPGYRYVGGGIEHNVYLHEASQTVYKLPNAYARPTVSRFNYHYTLWEENEERQTTQREQQEAYASLSLALMEEEGCTYIPTSYLTVETPRGQKIPMQVQAYLPPAAYDDPSEEELMAVRANPRLRDALMDVHGGNFLVRRSDGVLVFFDGL